MVEISTASIYPYTSMRCWPQGRWAITNEKAPLNNMGNPQTLPG